MTAKDKFRIYVLLCLPVVSSSCDTFYIFGVINNHSHRTIKVIITDKTLEDSQLYSGRLRALKLPPMGTTNMYLGFGLPQVPKEHQWYVKFFDEDTLLKCYRSHDIAGSMQKAFLKEDTISKDQMLKRNILLSYDDSDINKLKR